MLNAYLGEAKAATDNWLIRLGGCKVNRLFTFVGSWGEGTQLVASLSKSPWFSHAVWNEASRSSLWRL